MKLNFFSNTIGPSGISESKPLVKKLIKFRASGFISGRFNDAELNDIYKLVVLMGTKILKANVESTQFPRAKEAFEKTIEHFQNSSPFEFCMYAAFLFQYYTVVCHEELSKLSNTEAFYAFLSDKTDVFGEDVHKNPWIIEYKLIKIYNDLDVLTQSENGVLAPIPKEEQERRFNALLIQLSSIKEQIDAYLVDAPDHAFIHYLEFCSSYVCAKALDFQYTVLSSSLDEDKKHMLSASQQYFLNNAQESLKKIERVFAVSKEREERAKGIEYSFGQPILWHLPSSDISTVKVHVASLIR